MKTIHKGLTRLVLLTCFIAGYTVCFSQKPVIRKVDKVSGSSGEVVTIQGTFNNDATRTSVTFGAVKGGVQFISDQLLEVAVPAGTTYENIVVTDLTSGLSDQSEFPFLLSFGGNHGITGASLEGQVDFNSESGLYDLCMCDFDNDQQTDIATANDGTNTLNVFANTTALSGLPNISFNRIPFLIGTRSIHARCGDLNGDGKPDLVVSEGGANGDRIFVFRNTSTGAGVFTFSIQSITLTGKKVKRTDIADLDNDGKPELIITNQTGNNVSVLINQSTTAAISFVATPITLNITGAASTDGLAVEDLDGDGLPEIVTSQFLTQTSNIFILENTSIPGNISLTQNQTLSISGTVVNIKIGDLDGDDKPEIAATQLIGSGTISIFKNQSAGTISFAAPISILTDVRPWGVDFGDIDGDGLPDIVVASLEKSLTVLNNESTPGNLAFSTLVQPTTFINRHVGIGDVDGDGKPDIVFTSVDDNNNNILASKVSVFRNKSCLVPSVNPIGPITICSGFPLQLTATPSRGTNYEWMNAGSTVANGADAFFDVTVSGAYTVTATGEGGACSETSNTVNVTVDPGMTSGVAVPDNDGPVCPGSVLSLFVNDVTATAYNWTGPNGYTGTGLTPAPIANFQSVNAGRYYLDVVVNGCIAQQASTVVDMINVPDFQVSYTGSDVFCPPATKTLSIVPNDPDFSYQWAERTGGNIGGATSPTLVVSATGKYYVKAQYIANPACAAIETPDVVITATTPPVADFTAPLTGCTGEVIDFTNQSTGAAAQTKFYNWTFGDSQTSSDENPSHQFATANTFTVTLRVTYNNGACEAQANKNITIQSAPAAIITTPGSIFEVCSGDSLLLEVPGPFSAYLWNTNETSPSIHVTDAGTYAVDVTSGTCIITTSVTVDSIASPVVVASADPLQINEGETSQLLATGLDVYSWDPAATLSDASLADPVASPVGTTIYTVTGTDTNGCTGMATVEVSVKGDFIVNKLIPSKFISPDNGDAINDSWLVGNILDYPQCSVTIYDDKGIKVYEAKPYVNDWTGTFNGKQLPDGVYYYVLRCDGEENNPRAGSITVLR
ncbi:MAG: FG-GAP-like repeat-containing protein [Cyclobacteriaceae bacterium]